MKVALIGATGPVGKYILQELLHRGHTVTAIVRNVSKVPEVPGVVAAGADIHDVEALSSALRGHDAVISAVRFMKSDPGKLIAAIKQAGITRYISVGGAASLFLPGTTTRLLDSGQIPEQYLPEPTAGTVFFALLKQERELEWTFLSPSMTFSDDSNFGTGKTGRTCQFRIGSDEMLFDELGISSISYEDYAVALVDELEQPMHIRKRFTVGY
jgi:putative NADH-flavin reductase